MEKKRQVFARCGCALTVQSSALPVHTIGFRSSRWADRAHYQHCMMNVSRITMFSVRPWSIILTKTDLLYQSHSGKKGEGVFCLEAHRCWGKGQIFHTRLFRTIYVDLYSISSCYLFLIDSETIVEKCTFMRNMRRLIFALVYEKISRKHTC